MNILIFGHIPSWAGGRQEHGLANVIYNLALSMSEIGGNNVVLAATDVMGHDIKRGNLLIKGWRKKELITYILLHPFFSLFYFTYLMFHIRVLSYGVSILGVFLKGIFLRRTIERGNYEILHLHEASSWYYVKVVPPDVRIVVTFHGPYGISDDIPYRKKYSILEKNYLTSKRVSSIFFISHSLQKAYIEYYKHILPPTKVIINAYDNKIFNYIKPKQHDGLNFCTIGTIQPRKGQTRVIEGIGLARMNCHYYTIGAGSDESLRDLELLCTKYHVSHTHLGKKTPIEIKEILSEMDYMILPSSSEGFGLVFLEAIACGVPVILPKNLPIVEEKTIIKPFLNALLLEDYTPQAISNLFSNIKDLPKYNKEDVANSVLSCTWGEIAKEYIDSYNNIINNI